MSSGHGLPRNFSQAGDLEPHSSQNSLVARLYSPLDKGDATGGPVVHGGEGACSADSPRPAAESLDHSHVTSQYERPVGCVHYSRNCLIKAKCCNKYFGCRLCHDEEMDHSIDRKATELLACLHCGARDIPVGEFCQSCGIRFARYFCEICKFYDDCEGKEIYHCHDCGICRLGRREEHFHCKRCNVCLPLSVNDSHPCMVNSLEQNCPVCQEYLADSVQRVLFMKCGHAMHTSCFTAYTRTNYSCPLCWKSLTDMPETEKKVPRRASEDIGIGGSVTRRKHPVREAVMNSGRQKPSTGETAKNLELRKSPRTRAVQRTVRMCLPVLQRSGVKRTRSAMGKYTRSVSQRTQRRASPCIGAVDHSEESSESKPSESEEETPDDESGEEVREACTVATNDGSRKELPDLIVDGNSEQIQPALPESKPSRAPVPLERDGLRVSASEADGGAEKNICQPQTNNLPPAAARWLQKPSRAAPAVESSEGAASEALRRVEECDFEPHQPLFEHIAWRMQQAHGVNPGKAAQVVKELKRCLIIIAAEAVDPSSLSMPDIVDLAWHEALLETREYADMCSSVFGRFIHHSSRRPIVGQYVRDESVARLLSRYSERYSASAESGWIWNSYPKGSSRAASKSQSPRSPTTLGDSQNKSIVIKVRDAEGTVLSFKARRDAQVEKLLKAYVSQMGARVGPICFFFDGTRLCGDETLSECGAEDGDVFDAMVLQRGC